MSVCVRERECVCVRACLRACVRACVRMLLSVPINRARDGS